MKAQHESVMLSMHRSWDRDSGGRKSVWRMKKGKKKLRYMTTSQIQLILGTFCWIFGISPRDRKIPAGFWVIFSRHNSAAVAPGEERAEAEKKQRYTCGVRAVKIHMQSEWTAMDSISVAIEFLNYSHGVLNIVGYVLLFPLPLLYFGHICIYPPKCNVGCPLMLWDAQKVCGIFPAHES